MESKEFIEVPDGNYICEIRKCEYGRSKSGNPQLTTWLRIVQGACAGQYMFYYQSIKHPVGKDIAQRVHALFMDETVQYVQVTKRTTQGKTPGVTFDNYYVSPYLGSVDSEVQQGE